MGKWDFDGDEILFFVAAGVIGIFGILHWYWTLIRISVLGRSLRIRTLLALAPLPPLLALWFVLTHWADPKEVVGNLDYQLLFLTGGLAWLSLAIAIPPHFGVSARSDAIERSNSAAATVVCGAMLGSMLIYCGGNVGSGPTIWTTIAPAFVASLGWLAAWLLCSKCSLILVGSHRHRSRPGRRKNSPRGISHRSVQAHPWPSRRGRIGLPGTSTFQDMLHLSWPVFAATGLRRHCNEPAVSSNRRASRPINSLCWHVSHSNVCADRDHLSSCPRTSGHR